MTVLNGGTNAVGISVSDGGGWVPMVIPPGASWDLGAAAMEVGGSTYVDTPTTNVTVQLTADGNVVAMPSLAEQGLFLEGVLYALAIIPTVAGYWVIRRTLGGGDAIA